jgi:starch phosphorylase
MVPRTLVLSGKAAPAYQMAKLIIRFAHALSTTLAADAAARDLLRLIFVPDFNVKNAQHMYPAADLAEHISTAGREASGTGNMKFALNGALSIGTLDGANIEIREAVGAENFFLVLARDPELAALLEEIAGGRFSQDDRGLFRPLVNSLSERDPFFVLADFRAYAECQARVAQAWQAPDAWTRASILNTASMGSFSSDRAIREYAERIWRVSPVPIDD